MPTPIITGDILLTQAICTQAAQTSLNDVHYRCSSHVGGGATDAEIAANMEASLAPLYKQILTSTANWYGFLVQRILPPPTLAHTLNIAHQGPGVAGGTPVNPEVAALIAVKTALAGRAFQGRVYLPFLDDTHMDATRTHVNVAYLILASLIGGVLFAPTTVVGAGGTSTITPVVFHRAPNKAGTTVANGTTDVGTHLAEALLATQRRRGPRGRANVPPT